MLNVLVRQFTKNPKNVGVRILSGIRMCSNDSSSTQSSGHSLSSNQSQTATYGAPEFFEYNEYSFNDIHSEMEKYRLPRPSSKTEKDNK